MMSDENFDPVSQFTNLKDSLRNSLSRAMDTGIKSVTNAQFPPVDIYKTDDSIIIRTAPIDGLDPSSIEVSMLGKELSISGITRSPDEIPQDAYLRRERSFGTFSRKISIPLAVKANEASAKVKGGVLTVTLPRIEDESEVIGIQVTE